MSDKMMWFIFGFIVGAYILGATWALVQDASFDLSQETGDDICRQLTGNESAVAEDIDYGKLVCLIPSYDETQNIIIKSNQE